jgi:hypothetical protein
MMLLGQCHSSTTFLVGLLGQGSATAFMHMERARSWLVMEGYAQRGKPDAQIRVLTAVASELGRVEASDFTPDLGSQRAITSPYRPRFSLPLEALGLSHSTMALR